MEGDSNFMKIFKKAQISQVLKYFDTGIQNRAPISKHANSCDTHFELAQRDQAGEQCQRVASYIERPGSHICECRSATNEAMPRQLETIRKVKR